MEHLIIQPLTPQHALAIAKIHPVSQSGTFLTSLGQDFLTLLYNQISQSDHSASYIALRDDEVIGFVVATFHTKKLFKGVAFKAPVRLSWLVFKQALRRPVLLWMAAKTLTYPSQEADNLPEAGLLALAVDTAWRNQKIGSKLVQKLVDNMRAAGIDKLVVTVDGNNSGALRFYHCHGFVSASTFKMYGRPMYHLVLTLSTEENS
jgi:ribosomal protein S18 acetylase RimI-like enzyme